MVGGCVQIVSVIPGCLEHVGSFETSLHDAGGDAATLEQDRPLNGRGARVLQTSQRATLDLAHSACERQGNERQELHDRCHATI